VHGGVNLPLIFVRAFGQYSKVGLASGNLFDNGFLAPRISRILRAAIEDSQMRDCCGEKLAKLIPGVSAVFYRRP
jgi:hypothetical protein